MDCDLLHLFSVARNADLVARRVAVWDLAALVHSFVQLSSLYLRDPADLLFAAHLPLSARARSARLSRCTSTHPSSPSRLTNRASTASLPAIIVRRSSSSRYSRLSGCVEESNTLAIATAGDDNAVAVHQFSTSFANAKLVLSSRVSPRSLFSAHSSTVQGMPRFFRSLATPNESWQAWPSSHPLYSPLPQSTNA